MPTLRKKEIHTNNLTLYNFISQENRKKKNKSQSQQKEGDNKDDRNKLNILKKQILIKLRVVFNKR